MSNMLVASVPLKNIQRVQIYLNKGKKTVSEIKAETGADYILNGTLYNMSTWAVNCHLKADGAVIAKPNYSVYGYAWNTGDDFRMTLLPDNSKQSYIACTPLIKDGSKIDNLTYATGQGGRRGRSAIGISDGNLVLYCSQDGTSDAKTPEALRDYLYNLRWDSAVMLDGGGSSQCNFAGKKITSTRVVQHLILVYLKDKTQKDGEPMKKVCLDAGHDAKSTNASPDKSYYEHEFALDMAKRIGDILDDNGVAVYYTRKGVEEVSLTDRCNIANAVSDLDLFVSIHSNAGANNDWSSASGWEAYVYSTTGGGYKAASAIMNRAKSVSKLRSTPIIANPKLHVVKNTKAPAVLIEHGFHTNKSDVALLKSADYRAKLAKAEAQGILDYLGIEMQIEEPAPSPAAPTGIDLTTLTDEQILYLANRIQSVLAKQTQAGSVAEELREAISLGITDGSSPCAFVTRAQSAVMAKRSAKLK